MRRVVTELLQGSFAFLTTQTKPYTLVEAFKKFGQSDSAAARTTFEQLQCIVGATTTSPSTWDRDFEEGPGQSTSEIGSSILLDERIHDGAATRYFGPVISFSASWTDSVAKAEDDGDHGGGYCLQEVGPQGGDSNTSLNTMDNIARTGFWVNKSTLSDNRKITVRSDQVSWNGGPASRVVKLERTRATRRDGRRGGGRKHVAPPRLSQTSKVEAKTRECASLEYPSSSQFTSGDYACVFYFSPCLVIAHDNWQPLRGTAAQSDIPETRPSKGTDIVTREGKLRKEQGPAQSNWGGNRDKGCQRLRYRVANFSWGRQFWWGTRRAYSRPRESDKIEGSI
ncbi:hypothetical protein BJY52DRAFT_1418290 [Lactarius psammicola]|nr:hypothetical protein BJY52DRAFT_1418290 [Lactarius psammicola]